MAEPIFDFQGLKDLLKRKGYRIGNAAVWRPIQGEEISLRKGNMDFENDGIFFTDEKGTRHQVFLYKRKYHIEQYGKPRYHICKCQVIEEFMVGRDIPQYRRANTSSVNVINWDNNDKEEIVEGLPLCKYCADIVYNDRDYDQSSSEFAEILKNALPAQHKEVKVNPITGYTNDWQTISSEYRKRHNYTCEKCGIQVSPFESEFMQVHHKNHNKTDNRLENLECLCIECHSGIDAMHVHNSSSRNKQYLISLFRTRYRKQR